MTPEFITAFFIEAIKTADMLAGNDGYCRNFLTAVRAGEIGN